MLGLQLLDVAIGVKNQDRRGQVRAAVWPARRLVVFIAPRKVRRGVRVAQREVAGHRNPGETAPRPGPAGLELADGIADPARRQRWAGLGDEGADLGDVILVAGAVLLEVGRRA